MDVILLPFLQASAGPEREQHLSDLIFVHAAPIVRHELRRRLGLYVNHQGLNPRNPDAEDLYHEVIAKLVQVLNETQLRRNRGEVRNFRQYVTRVATNACHDYLRARSPARSRLSNNLRELLERHDDFAVWRVEGDTLCGFVPWRDENRPVFSSARLLELEENPDAFRSAISPTDSVHKIQLSVMVANIFRWVDGPVKFKSLVNLVAALLDVKDGTPAPLSDEYVAPDSPLAGRVFHFDSRLEAAEVLGRVWEEIRRLPAKQRDTLCLSFEDESGDDLFSLLVDAGITNWSLLAQELGRPLGVLMLLWQRMPMDNAAVADELNATRQQVVKWRFRALRRLEKELLLAKKVK